MFEKKPLAVVTMVYNEAFFLPFWLRHYSIQAGLENCFILDHGSNDGSTDATGANVVKTPRSVFEETERAISNSDFCCFLLFYYHRVIFCDVDELIFCDPQHASNLSEYLSKPDLPLVIRSIGIDVLHDEAVECSLDPGIPVLQQRSIFRPYSALSKPNTIGTRVMFGVGIHSCNHHSEFDNLYLFHLAYADMGQVAERQRKRNSVVRVGGGGHHDILPQVMVDHIRNEYVLGKPRISVSFTRKDLNVRYFVAACLNDDGSLGDCHPNVLWCPSKEELSSFSRLEKAHEDGQ